MCTGGDGGGGGGGEQPKKKKKNPLRVTGLTAASFMFNPLIAQAVIPAKRTAEAAMPGGNIPEAAGPAMPKFSSTDTERAPEVANAAAAEVARSRGKGRKSTILTGALGLPGQATTTQKTLLGQ